MKVCRKVKIQRISATAMAGLLLLGTASAGPVYQPPGSNLTFGDVTLRKPHHETHELLGTETFSGCLGSVTLADDEKNR